MVNIGTRASNEEGFINKKGRKCALAHTARTVRGDIDQRKVESYCILLGGRIWISNYYSFIHSD